MCRHLLPNVLAPIVVLMTLGLGTAIITVLPCRFSAWVFNLDAGVAR
jgi:ABC-type microcin C transport system permease subunit YejE